MAKFSLLLCLVICVCAVHSFVQPLRSVRSPLSKGIVTMQASSDTFVPDMDRRNIMNGILLGSVGTVVLGLGVPYAAFFVPPSSGGGGGGTAALDALGNEITEASWLATHQAGDRSLVQGLKGDATYLIVNDAKEIESYALNAVCTHLGCVVPWNKAENKFKCPCHGSQYDKRGKVIRGPAPLSLALAHVELSGDNKEILLKTWTETDFRTNTAPWWK